MKSHADEQNIIRQYLLGLLPPEKQPALEERLLTEAAFYEQLLIVEDELIDQYLAGPISEAERERFESYFLITHERQEKVRFARALRRYILAKDVGPVEDAAISLEGSSELAWHSHLKPNFLSLLRARNPALTFSLGTIALLLVFGASWIAIRGLRPPQEPSHVFAVSLAPGLTRDGGEMTKITIPLGTDIVQFRLKVTTGKYKNYMSALFTADGSTVMTDESLKPVASDTENIVVVSILTTLLPPGDYKFKLSGIDADGNLESVDGYPFRIVSH